MDRERLKNFIYGIEGKYGFPRSNIEKDYYLTCILNKIENGLSDKIVFKGGTLLNKAYLNYHRLSEDLDFAYDAILLPRSKRSQAIEPIRERMAGFLKEMDLSSKNPRGEGFNNSTQYVFKAQYPSVITNKSEEVKIEISLREPPIEKPVHTVIKHFFRDPHTGEDIIPQGKVLSLTYREAVAEKLKAAITRKDVVIRDYYDLWHIDEDGFDFNDPKFIQLFQRKLASEKYRKEYWNNFGLSEEEKEFLGKQVESRLQPVIRVNEVYELNKTFDRFNKILSDKRLHPTNELEHDQGGGIADIS